VEPRFGFGYLTPAAARLAPHGDFAQVRALRRTGCESPKMECSRGESPEPLGRLMIEFIVGVERGSRPSDMF
jgi:hypothetical protein